VGKLDLRLVAFTHVQLAQMIKVHAQVAFKMLVFQYQIHSTSMESLAENLAQPVTIKTL
jgi:hypothetical protein